MLVQNILDAKGNKVFTIAADRSLADAVEMLNRHAIGALVVLDEMGRISGILSERDIVRHLGHDAGALLQRPVADCMTPAPMTCTAETTVAEVMEWMTRYRIRHLPVLDGRGALAGIVSIGDVDKRKIEEAEIEAAALRDYIAS